MSPLARTGLASVAALLVGLIFVLGIQRMVERKRTADRINELREELYRSRVAADRCRSALQTSEASLHDLRAAIDSLRVDVGLYETSAGRVPQARYDEYLEVFDEYNDSVQVWEGRERRLRSAEASCRATIERHNEISDSLQTVLVEAGIETG